MIEQRWDLKGFSTLVHSTGWEREPDNSWTNAATSVQIVFFKIKRKIPPIPQMKVNFAVLGLHVAEGRA